ncbi:MAG: D-aminoacylase [Planctomycetes bacterium]|nr:D-aminoacylase [Planctomycetota bacterium]
MFDIIIQNGTVIDGTKSPRFKADVGIQNGRIAAIGDLSAAETTRRISADGKIVAPGFIDVHNHSDGWFLKSDHVVSKTSQGFTSEVLMSDGISYAPVDEQTAPEWMFYLRALDALRMDEYTGWRTLADYLEVLDGANVQNAAVQVPYANVRALACGFGRGAVDDFQMRTIQREIRLGMEAGAVGVSTGLDYIAQCFSTTDELVEACGVIAEYDGLYVTHMRYKKGLMDALREAVEIGRRAGIKVHFSHLKALSAENSEQVLEYIDTTARQEVDLSFDVYPYQPGSTMLNFLLPYEVWEDGPLAVLGKLRDPGVRSKFAEGLKAYRLDLDHIRIAWVAGRENAVHQGKRLSDYIEECNLPAADALINLLIEERLAVLLVFDEGDDRLADPFLQHDLYMMGTDGIFFPDGLVHPRQYGSVGRLLGPLVRDHKLFSLEEAVYKLAGNAANRFGLTGRGILKEGNFADVVVFDAETVTDRATYDDPHQLTVGIEHVFVNGVPILADGKAIEPNPSPLPGRALRFRE